MHLQMFLNFRTACFYWEKPVCACEYFHQFFPNTQNDNCAACAEQSGLHLHQMRMTWPTVW